MIISFEKLSSKLFHGFVTVYKSCTFIEPLKQKNPKCLYAMLKWKIQLQKEFCFWRIRFNLSPAKIAKRESSFQCKKLSIHRGDAETFTYLFTFLFSKWTKNKVDGIHLLRRPPNTWKNFTDWSKIRRNQIYKGHNGNNLGSVENIPILNRGKSRLPLRWSMTLLILQKKANFRNYITFAFLFYYPLQNTVQANIGARLMNFIGAQTYGENL